MKLIKITKRKKGEKSTFLNRILNNDEIVLDYTREFQEYYSDEILAQIANEYDYQNQLKDKTILCIMIFCQGMYGVVYEKNNGQLIKINELIGA